MTDKKTTVEPQYDILLEAQRQHGTSSLGMMINQAWNQDPRHALFTLARYKFVSKMLEGRKSALEVGCADAFGTRLVQQCVGHVTAVDFDPLFIEDVKARMNPHWHMTTFLHDMLSGPVPPGNFDAAYALDVLEHIKPKDEMQFVTNIVKSLTEQGVLVMGMPSLESQVHASPQSKAGHVNCKSGKVFKAFMEKFFNTVFVFSMNDEVVHTGFYPMAHYLLAVGSHPKKI